MTVDVHLHKITADEAHPAPWRYWYTVDTLYGNFTDEGLASSEDEAVELVGHNIRAWLAAQRVARETKTVVTVEVEELDDDTE